ncbi:MAG: tRNA pseudouridine(55) synthase TruB [Lachnospiraceae bacterium]|nr:tRNA pseudouridine(55) synthase TruB [Lachnospiraceae bacterium]
MYNGIINVYKEAGFTSHDVVARLRGICKMKKIGHTGTLDPEAVGVLPVCFGSGTKLCDLLTDWDKEYVAVLRLGMTTDTQDMTGQVLSQCDPEQMASLTPEQVQETISSFQGSYDQIPPMYSALKVNGKKLYELARAGKEVERRPRTVQIKEIEILEMNLPIVKLRVVCSKGTYIRTLCHDIGGRLGCGGVMESLIRSRVGIFGIEDALTLSELERLRDEDKISDVIISPDAIFEECPDVIVNEQGCRMVQNGNQLGTAQIARIVRHKQPGQVRGSVPQKQSVQAGQAVVFTDLAEGEQVRVYDGDGKFYGIYVCRSAAGLLKPVKMFLG